MRERIKRAIADEGEVAFGTRGTRRGADKLCDPQVKILDHSLSSTGSRGRVCLRCDVWASRQWKICSRIFPVVTKIDMSFRIFHTRKARSRSAFVARWSKRQYGDLADGKKSLK